MRRLLLVASTTGYQVRSFHAAAERLGVQLVLATDRCHVLDDPWGDSAVPVRFHDEAGSVAAIVSALAGRPVDGVLAVGDRPARLAATAAEALSLRASSPDAVRAAGNKLLARRCFARAGLAHPWFFTVPADVPDPATLARARFPCVVKPLALSASRGVIRADSPTELTDSIARIHRLLSEPDVRERREADDRTVLVEAFVPGEEVALEGILTGGRLQVLAVFDKPDPLDGPFFEETIYVTPSERDGTELEAITAAVTRATAALGLTEGPVHAECRVNAQEVVVLEVANRPIGGLCARALRFEGAPDGPVSLERVLLTHALGESVTGYRRESAASGVMMIPTPADGLYQEVHGLADARAVDGIEDVVITAKQHERLRPLPEGSSYVGFIFARQDEPALVVDSLRASLARLRFDVAPVVSVVQPEGG